MLPGLRPAHTRGSFSSLSRLSVETRAPTVEDYTRLEDTGLWLLPAVIAERDSRMGVDRLNVARDYLIAEALKQRADKAQKGSRLLGRTAVAETGCMVDGLRSNQDPFEWALELGVAEWSIKTKKKVDTGALALTSVEDMPHIQTCGTEGCYNSRHFDIDFGRDTLRERIIEVNPHWYVPQKDGKIRTIWGDKLPSLEDSLRFYIDFQRQNFPFVPNKQSPLTPSGIAQVRFQPVTGCWEAWSYYCQNRTNLNWQYDGYGRLYDRQVGVRVDTETGEVLDRRKPSHKLAHRVVWKATGNRFRKNQVLNHLCSYRRCCNPLHIRQESKVENINHGIMVQNAIRDLYINNPDAVDSRMSAAELLPYHEKARQMYVRIVEEAGYAA